MNRYQTTHKGKPYVRLTFTPRGESKSRTVWAIQESECRFRRAARDGGPWQKEFGRTVREELFIVNPAKCNIEPAGVSLHYGDLEVLRLGTRQKAVMTSLQEHGGYWHDDCAWQYGTPSQTVLILESLVRKGFVSEQCDGRFELVTGAEANRHLRSALLHCLKYADTYAESSAVSALADIVYGLSNIHGIAEFKKAMDAIANEKAAP